MPLYPIPRDKESGLEPQSRFVGGALFPTHPLFFQRPLRGIEQDIATQPSARFIKVPPIPDLVPEQFVLFHQPMTAGFAKPVPFNIEQTRVSQLVGGGLTHEDIAPLSLFQTPRRALVPFDIAQTRVSQFYGTRLIHEDIAIPLDILFQRVARQPYEHAFEEFQESQFLFELEPTRDVLFLQPRRGVAEPIDEVVAKPRFIPVTPDDVPAPIDILFQRPGQSVAQAIEEVRAPALITVPFPDFVSTQLVFLPLRGIEQIEEELPASRFIKVTPADNLFLHVGQGMRMLQGIAQVEEEFRKPILITVPIPDILPPFVVSIQRPLVAVVQPELIVVPAPRIIRVPLADVFAPPSVGRKLRRGWFRSGG